MNSSSIRSVGQQDYGLTARERQIIALVTAGYTNKELARKLRISENSAKYHLTVVFDKLRVSNRLELVLFAVDRGLAKED